MKNKKIQFINNNLDANLYILMFRVKSCLFIITNDNLCKLTVRVKVTL